MDQPYSAWADLLNKFHTASEPIQALMVIVGGAIVLGSLMSLIGLLIQIVHTLRPAAPGTLLYGVYRTSDGHLVELRDPAALLTDAAEREDGAGSMLTLSFRGAAGEPGTQSR